MVGAALVLLTFLAAAGAAAAGLATHRIPLGWAIALFVVAVLAATLKVIVDYRKLGS